MFITEVKDMFSIDYELYMRPIKSIHNDAKLSKLSSLQMRLVKLAKTELNLVLEIS